jgi:hypothetical protein
MKRAICICCTPVNRCSAAGRRLAAGHAHEQTTAQASDAACTSTLVMTSVTI